MLNRKILLATIAGALCVSQTANAGIIIDTTSAGALVQLSTLVQPNAGGNYNPDSTGTDLSAENFFGWEGANLVYDNNNEGPYNFRWEYEGQESGYQNAIFGLVSGGNINSNSFASDPYNGPNLIFAEDTNSNVNEGDGGADGVVVQTMDHSSGDAVEFAFVAECQDIEMQNNGCWNNNPDDRTNVYLNGDNDQTVPNWFLGFMGEDENSLDFSTAYLFFNDGGASNDRDYDDLIVSVSLLDGPSIRLIPEPAALSLFGLGLIGVGLASRRRKQKA